MREGRGNTFITFLKERRKGDCRNAGNSREDSGTSEETIPEGQAGERVSILYENLGLYKIPTTAPYKTPVKADGRR